MELFLIDVEGSAEKLVAKLTIGAKLAGDPLPVVDLIAEDMFKIEAKVFSSKGRRGGGSWKKLKDDTVKRKGSDTILKQSGILQDSLTIPNSQYQILEVHKTGIIFGTSRPFAAVHQYGSTYNNRPARPFIKFMPYDLNRWNKMLLEYLVEPFAV